MMGKIVFWSVCKKFLMNLLQCKCLSLSVLSSMQKKFVYLFTYCAHVLLYEWGRLDVATLTQNFCHIRDCVYICDIALYLY